MAKLIYSVITSLDGYVADESGNFDWAAPDEEVHRFVNDLERSIGTYLYGRRMYDVMRYWETAHIAADQPPVGQDFAQIWQAADKIVYSKTLETASSARTRIERGFDPETIRQMKSRARRDITVGGPAVSRSRGGGRWQIGLPQPFPPPARTAGRTSLQQRHGLPALPYRVDSFRATEGTR
jgi:dihydrofolate reductase